MVRFLRIAATRPQIPRTFVSSKHPDASARPYNHAYSAWAHSAHAASLSDPHIASKSITRFGMGRSLYCANFGCRLRLPRNEQECLGRDGNPHSLCFSGEGFSAWVFVAAGSRLKPVPLSEMPMP